MDKKSIIKLLKVNNDYTTKPDSDLNFIELLSIALTNYNPSKYKSVTDAYTKKDWAKEITWRRDRLGYINGIIPFYVNRKDQNWKNLSSKYGSVHLAHSIVNSVSNLVSKISCYFFHPKFKVINETNMYDIWILKHYLEEKYDSINIAKDMKTVEVSGDSKVKFHELEDELRIIKVNNLSFNESTLSRLNDTSKGFAFSEFFINSFSTKFLKVNINMPKKILMKEFEDWIDHQQQSEEIKFTAYKFTDNEFLKWKNMNLLAAIDLYIISRLLKTVINDFNFTEREFLEILGVTNIENRIPDEYDKYEKIFNKLNEAPFILSLRNII